VPHLTGESKVGEAEKNLLSHLRTKMDNHGTKQIGESVVESLSSSASAIVKAAAETGADIANTAKKAVEGTIEAAKDIGVDTAEAASATAAGAIKAAGNISASAAEQVRNAVTGTIAGVKVIVKEPFKKQG